MRKTGFILLISCLTHLTFAQQKDAKPFAVVELFTSEGCSSCPPAEKLLSKIVSDARKNNKRIFPLEFHVDYWNKYGWKDPYSSLQFSKRQKRYVDISADKEMFTPQMWVNGKNPFVGSEEKTAWKEINEGLAQSPAFAFSISKSDSSTSDTLIVEYETAQLNPNYFLNVAIVERAIVMKVGKGENGGKTLQHDNVVRYFTSAELKSKKGNLKIPTGKLKADPKFSLIAFIQHKQNYNILGADAFDF